MSTDDADLIFFTTKLTKATKECILLYINEL
jgi:hypothetical protein